MIEGAENAGKNVSRHETDEHTQKKFQTTTNNVMGNKIPVQTAQSIYVVLMK